MNAQALLCMLIICTYKFKRVDKMTTKKLAASMGRSVSSVYETEQLREVILIHMDLIKNKDGNSSIEITQAEADKWWGDFYGLLTAKGVRPHMLWLITVFNGLSDSGAYNADFLEIQTPNMEYVDRIVDINNTIHI